MRFAALPLLLSFMMTSSCTQPGPSPDSEAAQVLAAKSSHAMRAQDYVGAQKLAAEATDLSPEFAEAWVGYGIASVKLGQTDRAREAYEKALSLHEDRLLRNPADANQAFQQIFILCLLGRTDEAEARLERARADFPEDQQISRLPGDFIDQKKWSEWSVTGK